MGLIKQAKDTLLTIRDSLIKDALAPLIQSCTVPIRQFNQFSISTAVNEGYKNTNMVYRCVNIISQNLVTLDFVIEDGEKNPIDNHPVAMLLDNPCPDLPPNVVKSIWWKQLELIGSAYMRFVSGPKPELWPLFPDKVQIVPSTEPGKLLKGYNFLNQNGISWNAVSLLPDEVIHLRQVDPSDGLAGISALRAGFRHVDILSEMDSWNYNSFGNRVLADTIISMKGDNITAQTMQTIRASIDEQLAGPKNARRVILAPGGTKVDRMSQTAVEMDFTNSKKLVREDIAVAYGVPLPILGIYDNGTFANVESAKRDFWEDTLTPKADDFCDTMTWFFRRVGMLKDTEKVAYKKQDIKALQRNYSDRAKDASLMVDTFVNIAGYNAPEVMEEANTLFELGFDMSKLKWEEPVVPPTLDPNNPVDPNADPNTPANPKDTPPTDAPKGAGNGADAQKKSQRDMSALDFHWRLVDRKRNTYTRRFKNTISTLFNTELNLLLKSVEDGVETAKLLKIVREHAPSWEQALSAFYTEVISDFGRPTKPLKRAGVKDKQAFDAMMKDRIHGFVSMNTGLKVRGITGHTMKKLEKIVSNSIDRHSLLLDAAQAVGEVVPPLDEYLRSAVAEGMKDAYANYKQVRALTIARTEVLGAASFGQVTGIALSGGSKKEWVSSRDSEVRDSHAELDGEVTEIDSSFSGGLQYPGDPSGAPEEIINCRCALVAVDTPDDEE